MAVVSDTMPAGGHIFVTMCMCATVPPDLPIKGVVLAK